MLDSEKLYADAMKNGCVERRVIKCLIIGAAGVGKTSIKHLLLKKPLPKRRESTGLLEKPAVAVSISRDVAIARAIMKSDCSEWYVVDNDEDLTKMIAKLIKTGVSTLPVTSQEMSKFVGTTPELVVDQGVFNSAAQDQDKRKVNSAEKHVPKSTAEGQKDSIHNKVISAIMEAKGMYAQ